MKVYPNILIVKGSGRNVGKTLSACRIIENLAKKDRPIAVKISPHFHKLDTNQKFIHLSDGFIMVEEKKITQKDSSRMLQAGAEKVYYVQAKNEFLPAVLNEIEKHIHPNQPVIIETGGLYDFMEPGLLLYVVGKNPKDEARIRMETKSVKLPATEINNFNWNSVQFKNSKFIVDAGI